MFENKSEQMNLTVSARLFAQLGEQLISDELVALMELIKNAYDADATEVKVNVDTKIETKHGVGKITISDNGNGMVPSIIKNGFLRLSTNFKKENKLTPHFERRVLGEKGLGRLSFQRLGRYVKVVTNPRYDRLKKVLSQEEIQLLNNLNQFEIDLDWNMLALDVDLNEIQANVDFLWVDKPKLGTVIEILGIKNLNFWNLNKTEEVRVKNEILGMVNPFIKGSSSNFQIYIDINGTKYTNENIDENLIAKIGDSIVRFSFNNWVLNINIEKKIRYAKREAEKCINELTKFNYALFSEGDYSRYLENNQYIIDFNNFENVIKIYPYLKKLKLDKLIDNTYAYPGNFTGIIYAADFSQDNRGEFAKLAETNQLSTDIKTYNELRTVWESANGIFIFRNEFRILPYGKKDWIGFTKKSQTYKYNLFKEHTVAGYITLDGHTSENLVEQTNRQGIVEDEYGKNFLRLFKEVLLEILVRDDVNFRSEFLVDKPKENQEYIESKNGILKFRKIEDKAEEQIKVLNETLKAVDEVAKVSIKSPEIEFRNLLANYFDQSDINNILNNSDNTIKSLLNAIMDSLAKGNQTQTYIADLREKINKLYILDKEVKQKVEQDRYFKEKEMDELYGLLPMAGQGIIVESLTHELNRIDEHIKTYASKSRDLLIKQPLFSIEEVIKNQQLIISETAYLREQLNHLEPTYRKNNKLFEKIDIMGFIRDIYINNGPMSRKAANKGIAIELTGKTFAVETNKGYLITILDNLFLNSLYWLEQSSENKKIIFEVYQDGRIIIYDSGSGIHKDIEDKLFKPFESMKKDGRGLGLYIVKELLNKLDADIYLDEIRRNDCLYKFVIKFNDILEG